MTDFLETNRNHWNTVTPFHLESEFYDVDTFMTGRDTVDSVEAELVGPVEGKTLLHLQCHFGLDTMSWSRRGAIAAGVDFSTAAIGEARRLAETLNLNTRFEVGDVLDLNLGDEFDIVFTSHGVLGWLPELDSWGETVARHLRPGGRFVVVDAHPVLMLYDEQRTDGEMVRSYDYFERAALEFEEAGSYAHPDAPVTRTTERIHPLEDTLGALLSAGLTITGFREYDFIAWQALPHMVPDDGGWWHLPEGSLRIPLMFSVTATK